MTVKYMTLPGWKQSIAKARKFSDLPPAAQAYVQKIEELIEVPGKSTLNQDKHSDTNYHYFPVRWIGVGPGRESIINC